MGFNFPVLVLEAHPPPALKVAEVLLKLLPAVIIRLIQNDTL